MNAYNKAFIAHLASPTRSKATLNLVPLHCDTLVYETGDAEPTTASSFVPTPARFEARGLQDKFLACDSADPERSSEVKTW